MGKEMLKPNWRQFRVMAPEELPDGTKLGMSC